MKTTNNIKKGMLIAMMALVGTTTFAQYRHYGHFHHYGGYYRPIVTTVVTRPAVTTHISNRLSKKDRLEMALAYLRTNKTLTVSKYCKMTGMNSTMAEAELDAFVANKKNPIRIIFNGKKKLYVLA